MKEQISSLKEKLQNIKNDILKAKQIEKKPEKKPENEARNRILSFMFD